jgi:hypothetical protein
MIKTLFEPALNSKVLYIREILPLSQSLITRMLRLNHLSLPGLTTYLVALLQIS